MTETPHFQREVLCENEECRAPLRDFVLTRDGFYVCPHCGTVDSGGRDLRSTPDRCGYSRDYTVVHRHPRYHTTVVNRGGLSIRTVQTSYSPTGTRGRYRPIFHWNERIAQLQLADPPLPPEAAGRIVNAAASGKYGAPEDFTRASIIALLRDERLDTYRERWKSILADINPEAEILTMPQELVDRAQHVHKLVLDAFFRLKHTMPKSTVRKNGRSVVRERHNVLPFNYEFRKIMEIYGIYDYHAELPLLRGAHKLNALDDVTERIFRSLALPFTRTAIIRRPKIRRSRQRKMNTPPSFFFCAAKREESKQQEQAQKNDLAV